MAFRREPCRDLGDFSHLRVCYSQEAIASIYSSRMQDKIKKQILDAFFVVLRPIAKILLRYGIGFREFAEVAKSAFVDVATTDHGIRGRPTNISRVAVMTGLTRKEVRRIRDKIENQQHTVVSRTTPLWDVLHHWHADDEFIDSSGRPTTLPFHGDNGSFEILVRKYGGDIPAGAMRAELKRVGAIVESDAGELTVVKRSFRPEGNQEILVNSLIHGVYTLLSTVCHNTNAERVGETWAQRVAFSQNIKQTQMPTVRRICFDRIHDFTQAIDDSFIGYEKLGEDTDSGGDGRTVAVGIFYFEKGEDDTNLNW